MDRAVHFDHLGELSAARQALRSEPLAPGDDATTLQQLRDPARRPSEPYDPLDPGLSAWLPDTEVALSSQGLLTNLFFFFPHAFFRHAPVGTTMSSTARPRASARACG